MKIDKYAFPDGCNSCVFVDDFSLYGQGSICIRCPIFNCSGDEPLVPPDDYRLDWAEEWDKFFKGEIIEPDLRF